MEETNMSNSNAAKLIDFNGTKEELDAIENISKTAQKVLKGENNIYISRHEAIPTIVSQFLYVLAQYLEQNKDTEEDISINLMNFMELGVTYRESDDGEKSGNFVPFTVPGTIFKTVIKSDENTENEQ